MRHRLLIVGEGSGNVGVKLGGVFGLDGSCLIERSSWDRITMRNFDASANLVVAVAVDHMHRAVSWFESLQYNPISTPTFAILPGEADAASLRITTQVVDDFALWPVRDGELYVRVMRLLGSVKGAGQAASAPPPQDDPLLPQLVGSDPAFVEILQRLRAFGRTEAPVLITGETGTGKEMCARAIHHLSPRRSFPFIPVDCAAIPDHLFENELFGHARGAYTDAQSDQKGLVSLAGGGMLFLDEIDTLPAAVQAKLLRFLQERTYRPLGSDRFMRSDVRVVTATNQNIERCVRSGAFRSDLYFRLNVLRLELPPLRERRADVPLLARHFLSLLSDGSSPRKTFTAAALQKLSAYEWPGNIREVYNIVQRAMVFSDGPLILPCHICLPGAKEVEERHSGAFRDARARNIEAFERRYVEDLLRQNSGNVTRAARVAGKERRAFGRLIKKYGINPGRA
ncbi:MAG TPA: sigma-54 dependent transcriptional regulator [Candidatus Acidoferrales bacterium]|jgi:two-component system response regulator GlrR|nr:sigma-54 dependent transcriptional regulator [Candidatus Acidoferrales bacterium]